MTMNFIINAFKAADSSFFGLKIIQNTYLGKYITNQCSKLSVCLSSIQSGKLCASTGGFVHTCPVHIKELWVVGYIVNGGFDVYTHICTHKEGASGSRLYFERGCWRWRFIAFSHST